MNPPMLNFFKKSQLYQELKTRDSRVGDDKAWCGEKEILRWTVLGHRHLGTPIHTRFVQDNRLTDPRYDNFPDDAKRSMENLISRGYAKGTTDELYFLKEGLLMGEVIYDVKDGKSWCYEFIYWSTWVAWAAVIVGAVFTILKLLSAIVDWVKTTVR